MEMKQMSSVEYISQTMEEYLSNWTLYKTPSLGNVIEVVFANGNMRVFIKYSFNLYNVVLLVVGSNKKGVPLYKGNDYPTLEEAISDLINNYLADKYPYKI